MNRRPYLTVLLQAFPEALHPISRAVLTTAIRLSREGGYTCRGVLFTAEPSEALAAELKTCGLDEVLWVQGSAFSAFIPEEQTRELAQLAGEDSDVLLFPATPEGRALSAMTASVLHTGVTADCTELSFNEEGLLVQTRPAFSGTMMASILTGETRPQIASLRFGSKVEPNGDETKLTVLHREPSAPLYETEWTERVDAPREEAKEIILAVGGGLKEKDDLDLFRKLADKLGAELCCSRILVERGWLPRSCQIGLSGRSVEPRVLIAFGISGSVQFRAGLGAVGTLCAVNTDPNAPLMKLADLPLTGDLYGLARAMLDA